VRAALALLREAAAGDLLVRLLLLRLALLVRILLIDLPLLVGVLLRFLALITASDGILGTNR
jgi:hypothetical protein